MALQNETGKIYYGDEVGSQAKLTTRRSFDSMRNNLKEIQRNLEIWLARIIGDLNGILTRDDASCQREYYISSILLFITIFWLVVSTTDLTETHKPFW